MDVGSGMHNGIHITFPFMLSNHMQFQLLHAWEHFALFTTVAN